MAMGPRPSDADEVVCPACHRIADREPAGFVFIEGEFATQHRDELVHLLRSMHARGTPWSASLRSRMNLAKRL